MQPRTHFRLKNLHAPHGAPLLMEDASPPAPSLCPDDAPTHDDRELGEPRPADSNAPNLIASRSAASNVESRPESLAALSVAATLPGLVSWPASGVRLAPPQLSLGCCLISRVSSLVPHPCCSAFLNSCVGSARSWVACVPQLLPDSRLALLTQLPNCCACAASLPPPPASPPPPSSSFHATPAPRLPLSSCCCSSPPRPRPQALPSCPPSPLASMPLLFSPRTPSPSPPWIMNPPPSADRRYPCLPPLLPPSLLNPPVASSPWSVGDGTSRFPPAAHTY